MTGGPELDAAAEPTGSAAALQQIATAIDTAVVESPLPGGVAELVRFLMNTVPTWVQVGGVILGAIVAVIALVSLVRNRGPLAAWFASRDRGFRIALGAVAFLILAGAAGAGAATWNYTQHSNEFCVSCHVMNPAFHKFSNAENKHAELSCHDCHQQSMYASARQVYLWVAERPEEIGEHAKIRNEICATCHITGDTARWQRVASTAGHRVHLESDSTALANLQCVTCHGVEVHRFRPVAETCGQSGCHSPDSTRLTLGKMAGQTVRHCTSCHGFTIDVPALATRDSAVGTLVPGRAQCLGCHEMRAVLADFDERRDPHGGKCGSCHNPHTQETPAAAASSCATSGCHANWRDEPFHVGASHRAVGSQCLTCHVPHAATVDASDCQACHEAVRARGVRRPPLRFDTSAALRRGDTLSAPPPSAHAPEGLSSWHSPPHRGDPFPRDAGDDEAPIAADEWTPEPHASGVLDLQAPAAAADTFPHARHEKLACLVCHQTGSGHGRLTFEAPRGCAICHHQDPVRAQCETCHRSEDYGTPKPKTITITVPGSDSRLRPVDFLHATHSARVCTECHTTPVTLALAPVKSECRDCHAEHHAVERQCSACHQIADPKLAHTSPQIAHQRCDACHTRTTIERLTPNRNFCGTCHAANRSNHYEPRECTVCHFLAEPSAYRAHLITRAPG